MKLLVKFPTKGRRKKFFEVLRLYHSMLAEPENTQFLVTLDEDDPDMAGHGVARKLRGFPRTLWAYGKSADKMCAVNRDMGMAPVWDILLLAADDMIPVVDGYDGIIRAGMREFYPDTDGVLFFNDGFRRNELNTLPIMGRKYYERFGYIYQPEYKSTWSDQEFTRVADLLGRQTYFDRTIIRHEHPDWGYGSEDEIHRVNLRNEEWDKSLFLRRQRENFGLPRGPAG